MQVLVDTSVWIDFFRGKSTADSLNTLIDDDLLCVNDLILLELIPSLKIKREKALISLLERIPSHSMDLDWPELIRLKTLCIKSGLNQAPIADLMLVQYAQQYDLAVWSFDKHFKIMSTFLSFELAEFS